MHTATYIRVYRAESSSERNAIRRFLADDGKYSTVALYNPRQSSPLASTEMVRTIPET